MWCGISHSAIQDRFYDTACARQAVAQHMLLSYPVNVRAGAQTHQQTGNLHIICSILCDIYYILQYTTESHTVLLWVGVLGPRTNENAPYNTNGGGVSYSTLGGSLAGDNGALRLLRRSRLRCA